MSTPSFAVVPATRLPDWLLSPILGLVFATVLWSGNFVVGRAVRGEIEPLALNFWRWLIAAVVLAPFVWRAFAMQWPLIRAHWRHALLLGLTGLAVPHTCSYAALQTTSAVNALLILILTPVFVAIGGWRFMGQAIGRRQWAGIAVALMGAASIVLRWDLDVLLQLQFRPGDLWMLPAVLGASAHTLLLRKTAPGITQGPLLLASIVGALGMMAPLLLWTGVGALGAITQVWGAALYVGVFASAAAFFLWNRGVVRVGPERAAPFMYLMPLYASVLSALFVGEGVQRYQVAGGALVLAGLWMAKRR